MDRPSQLSLQITWSCNIRCSHCCQDHVKVHLPEDHGRAIISEFAARQLIDFVGITGGEPFVRYNVLKSLIRHAGDLELQSGIVTNALWATSRANVIHLLTPLIDHGLVRLVVSYDAYHADFVPEDRVMLALELATELNLHPLIYATYGSPTSSQKTERILSCITSKIQVPIAKRDLLPVGHGSNIEPGTHYQALDSLPLDCPSEILCVVWPDGRFLPCCMAGTHERLALGKYPDDTLETIITKLHNWELLKAIQGNGLHSLLEALPSHVRERFMSSRYSSPCHLCYRLFDDTEASTILLNARLHKLDPVDDIFSRASQRTQASLAEAPDATGYKDFSKGKRQLPLIQVS